MPSNGRANRFIPGSSSPNSTAGSHTHGKPEPGAERCVARPISWKNLTPAFAQLGFSTRLIKSPTGKSPYLLAEYRESASAPTVLMYGHGDVVDGMVGEWRDNLDPWRTTVVGNRVYGRGTADNKGQHSINLSALGAVREARGGRLGFNVKFIVETGEEIGSPDLREVCESLREELKADVFLASDGPRLAADRPTIFLGCRGGLRIHARRELARGLAPFRQLGRRPGQSRDHPRRRDRQPG